MIDSEKSDSEGELTDVTPTASPRPDEAGLGLTREVTIIESNEFKDDDEDDALEQAAKDAEIELEKEELQDIRVSVQKSARPKSAHPRNRGRKVSNSGSDLNHLLEAVLILDQKGAEREMAKNPNPFPPRAVGSARGSRKSSFQASERQREIQKENERLLKELTKQRRRPNSATSVSSVRSNMSRGSGFSTASAVEFRKSANCRGSPIARNYHSKINRSKEAKRIDEENLALLRRLQNVRASPMIALSRQQVTAPPRARPKSMRPKIESDMVKQRLISGSIRVTQSALKSLTPGGKAFSDLRPPMPQELAGGVAQLMGMIPKTYNGQMWQVTTSAAALNAVAAFEVWCWYCVGEIIGKGSIIGYDV